MNDIIEYHTYNRVDFSLKQLYYHVSIVLYIFFCLILYRNIFLMVEIQLFFPLIIDIFCLHEAKAEHRCGGRQERNTWG